jgi:amino acid permease
MSIYLANANTIIPIGVIPYEEIYKSLVNSLTYLWDIVIIISYTAKFIAFEGIKSFIKETNTFEKFLLTFVVVNFILLTIYDYSNIRQTKSTLKVLDILDSNLKQMRKREQMREDWEQLWAEEIKRSYEENEKKLKEINKQIDILTRKMKKTEKALKEYE